MEKETVLSAESIRNIQLNKEVSFIYNKIKESAYNFKMNCVISSDYEIGDKALRYFKDLGYKINKSIDKKVLPQYYIYEISWKG